MSVIDGFVGERANEVATRGRLLNSPHTPASHIPVRTGDSQADGAPPKFRDSGISISVESPCGFSSVAGSSLSRLSRPGTPRSIRSEKSASLTPTSAVSRLSTTPSRIKPRGLQTSQGTRFDYTPGGRRRADTKGPSSPSTSPSASPYMNAHVADACVVGCLVHHLSSCGHKIITAAPEACASNCRRQYEPQVSQLANPVTTEAAFLCAACIESHLEHQRQSTMTALASRYQMTAERMPDLSKEFVQKRIEYWSRVLTNDIDLERKELEKIGGRPSCLIPGEPLFDNAEDGSVFWPPRHKPKESRTPGHQPRSGSLWSAAKSSEQSNS